MWEDGLYSNTTLVKVKLKDIAALTEGQTFKYNSC